MGEQKTKPEPKFKVGQRVWINWPRKCEHGMSGIVEKITPWDGIKNWDTYCYRACWETEDKSFGFVSSPGERMLSDKDPLKTD